MQEHDLNRFAQNPQQLDALTPREFEELVACVLEFFGWQVGLTRATRDGGYDVLAYQKDIPGVEVGWIVECKHYDPKNKVSVDIVRSLFGVRDYLGIANAAIVTTSSFTSEAINFAKACPAIKLIDRSLLQKWLAWGNIGLPVELGAAPMPGRAPEATRFRSVFISYSTKDEEFVRKLHQHMADAGIRAWFAAEDIRGGEKIHEQLFRASQLFDKLLVVLSPDSLKSDWVVTEIRKARGIERKENRRKLFPIRLVEYEKLREWECVGSTGEDLAEEVRQYYIPDFSNWKDHEAFGRAFDRLQKALQSSDPPERCNNLNTGGR